MTGFAASGSIIGYFSLRTNRMTMYDLTGTEAPGRVRKRRNTPAQIKTCPPPGTGVGMAPRIVLFPRLAWRQSQRFFLM